MEFSLRRRDSMAVGLLANYGGKAVVALLTVIALPILYQQLNSEGFGLFGFFYSLLALITLFDFGLSSAAQRDLAAMAGANGQANRMGLMRQCIHSLELPVIAVALAFCICVTGFSEGLATGWLRPRSLSTGEVAWSIRWMVLAASGQLLATYYASCLNGLSQFKWVNGIQTSFALLRFAAMLTVAGWLVPNDHPLADRVMQVFAVWAVANLTMAGALRMVLLRNFRGLAEKPRMDPAYLRRAFDFGLSVAGVTLLIMVFNQVDKFAASRTLNLAELGHYSMIWSLADVLYLFYFPIYTSFLPLLAARAADDTPAGLPESIQLAWDCMALAVVPAAVSLLVLPDYAIWAWTGDAALGSNWGYLLAIAMAAATFNAFLFVAFAVQQVSNRLRIWVRCVVLALVVYLPVSICAVVWFGAPGGIIGWSAGTICLASVLMVVCFSDQKYAGIRGALVLSALRTIASCVSVALVIRVLMPQAGNRWAALATLAVVACTLYIAAAIAQRRLSARIFNRLQHVPMLRGL